MTTDQEARPNVPVPIDSASRIAFTALAQFFDERHAARMKMAEDMRSDEDPDYPEHRTMADAWLHAANTTWEVVGGRPDGSFAHCDHRIKISVRELGKLLELASSSHSENDAEFAETNRVLTTSAQRIRELTKERDAAHTRIAELEKQLAKHNTSLPHPQTGSIDLEFIEANGGRLAVCVDGGRFHGWVMRKHVDGYWVSERKASSDELAEALRLQQLAQSASKPNAPTNRIFLGITFERELPDGSRENVDPSTVRLVVADESTPLLPVRVGDKTS